MYLVDCTIGRLVEARAFSFATADEVEQFQRAMMPAFVRAGDGAIVCADWRPLHTMPPAITTKLIGLLTHYNPRLQRSAILLSSESAVFSMQVERMVRAANNPARRAFLEARQLTQWLGEVMTFTERIRMQEFLAGYRPG